jgi:Spy/CpxP family protein refolding chaperone
MKQLTILLISATGLLAQMPPMGGQMGGPRYQPTFDDVKATLGLTDDQVAKLKQLQQDKTAATQAFYGKMSEKQKELNQLLESNSADAAKVGQVMLELQQLRKQPPPGAGDTHEKALALLDAGQQSKLEKLQEALKLRNAVDQALQLALLNPPPPAAPKPMTVPVTPPAAKPAKP